MMFAPLAAALPHVQTGRLKALAVTTERRSGAARDIPTMSEAGVRGYEAFPWYGVLAPSGTPRAIIDVLQKTSTEIIAQPDMREKMAMVGIDPDGRGTAEFARFIKVEMDRWSSVIRSAGLRAN
jgi:tripartite-type tricarboxylate transporter receptor subunit TctC